MKWVTYCARWCSSALGLRAARMRVIRRLRADIRSHKRALVNVLAEAGAAVACREERIASQQSEISSLASRLADVMRQLDDRTRWGGALHGRLEAVHGLIDKMPPDVAEEVRRIVRPGAYVEAGKCQ